MRIYFKCKILISMILLFALTISCKCNNNKTTPLDPIHSSDNGAWTRYSGNPVLRATHHTGGSTTDNDYFSLNDCCVIKESNIYKIWYTASGGTATKSSNHANIAYATSMDGITWTKHSGPVLDITPLAWDKYAVETVSVIIDTNDISAKKYKMWYSGQTNKHSYDIGYAYSSDGINWTKYSGNPVMVRGTTNEWDNYFIEGPTVIKDGSTYKMWYAGADGVAGHSTFNQVNLGYATSLDGINWIKNSSPVMLVGASGTWEMHTVQDPCVIKYNGIYYLWYSGKNANDVVGYGQQTGFAYSSDGITWIKSANNPVFKRGNAGQWDATTSGLGSVIIDENKVKLWYTGMDNDYNPPTTTPNYWDLGYAERTIINGDIRE